MLLSHRTGTAHAWGHSLCWYANHYANDATHCMLMLLDTNECDRSPCDQLCTNTEGSFECGCREGYQLHDGGRNCEGKPLSS